ncbi:PINc/VapC family ATPase [Oxyplasma meridianum]|uniref:PINc/VapC family ATPase n=1 Tax=Oxyplasma meridianum TaxID=3073602 RepID=A0AAX4NHA9_9ARCH
MDYVPDTSVIVDGRFNNFIKKKEGSKVILAEAMLAEIEHQANQGRSIGFAALQELKNLREMADANTIYLEVYGRRPSDWQIDKAKSGEIDEIIRSTAAELGATLVTGDNIQKDLAIIKGVTVEFLEHPKKVMRSIEEFFDETTTSVHLKAGQRPFMKKGVPGDVRIERHAEELSNIMVENIANDIVKRGKLDEKSFIEMDSYGATVIQLRDIRIVITRPPFSDDIEITAVRPIVKLNLEYYKPSAELINRLETQANGIIIAGAPGAGKSTFVQALAEHLSDQMKIVKTMEKPRDLQVKKDITQYTELEGSMEKTGDILLLVREDYTVFDEMRVTSDFRIYSDLRLAGVGMVGVVHATRPIDALQRFIGRVELGLIPQIIDTIVFIDKGNISKVLITEYVVKVPSGMTQEDLSRPVIVVKDFYTSVPVYEIYTFGDQIVVVPVSKKQEKKPIEAMALDRITETIRDYLGTSNVKVSLKDENRALIRVDEKYIPRLIGKKGVNISELEKKMGIKLDVEPEVFSEEEDGKIEVIPEIKNKIIYMDVKKRNVNVRIYADNILILQARSSSKGIIRIKMSSDLGIAITKYIKEGKKFTYSLIE